jgi:hypothetical protein
MADPSPETDTKIAEYFRNTGRGEMADQMEASNAQQRDSVSLFEEDPVTDEPDAQAEGEQFVADLKAALRGNKVSLPGLLDR